MARRMKLFFIGIMIFTVSMLVYTSHLGDTHPANQQTLGDFYHKTKTALDSPGRGGGTAAGSKDKAPPVDLDADGDVDEEDARLAREMAERLKAAEQQAKDLANAKAPNRPDRPSDVVGVGSSANGQQKTGAEAEKSVTESEEEQAVDAELNLILKKAPVIIFSKTYCPYSKRAKGLLLDKYVIEPTPFVVELDTHPLGPALQAKLGIMTGRRTVPNILVGGKSIGGSDDIADLDTNKLLVDKVKSFGGKLVDMKERLVSAAGAAAVPAGGSAV